MRIKLLPCRDSDYAIDLIAEHMLPQLRRAGARAWRREDVLGAWAQCQNFEIWHTGSRIGIMRLQCDEPGVAVLEDLHLESSQQRRGFGRACITAACDWARQQGCARLELAVVKDTPAEQFYLRLGFQVYGKDSAFLHLRYPLV